jgi:glutamine amidotransferase
MMTIIDYGVGNVLAFMNVYKRLNVPVAVARTSEDLRGASKVILPGVGSFDHAMARFNQSGMRPAVEDMVLSAQVPVIGVCVGMQMLARGSDEGKTPGLGWLPGGVRAFRSHPDSATLPIPHMGWNDIRPAAGEALFRGLETDPRFYFLHSFYFECDRADDCIASTTYGLDFACAVRSRNVYGVQFHPEKSHHYGAQLLKNFSEL